MSSIFMGNPKTPRYKILKALHQYRALGFRDLCRKTSLYDSTLIHNIKRLIKERIVNKWDFGLRALYAHCFVPWYEVQEIYDEKYLTTSRSRIQTTKKRRMFERVLKD